MSHPGVEAATEPDQAAASPGSATLAQPVRMGEALITSIGIGAVAGAAAGFVWGGIGGRIAMRVLFLTSSENVKGVISDDGFEIGTISGATVFLLIFTSILGGIAGAVYGFLRIFLTGSRPVVVGGVGLAAAAFGGAMLVHSDGIDFKFLDPLWLAVTMFVLIPGLWGITVVPLTERLAGLGARHAALPVQLDARRFGLLGWAVLLVLTVVGIVDLLADLDRLT